VEPETPTNTSRLNQKKCMFTSMGTPSWMIRKHLANERAWDVVFMLYPIGSMYGIFTYIYDKNQLNVGEYTIHGWYGYLYSYFIPHSASSEKKIPGKQENVGALCL